MSEQNTRRRHLNTNRINFFGERSKATELTTHTPFYQKVRFIEYMPFQQNGWAEDRMVIYFKEKGVKSSGHIARNARRKTIGSQEFHTCLR